MTTTVRSILFLVIVACAAPAAAAGTRPNAEHIARALSALDADISQAYNTCGLNRLRQYFSPFAELYFADRWHSTRVGELIDDARRNVCGKLRRETVPASLEVHPVKAYGAIQIGEHRFCRVDRRSARASRPSSWHCGASRTASGGSPV